MTTGQTFRTGQRVLVQYQGREVEALIMLASGNGASLLLRFEAMLGGYVGAMPVLRGEDGSYRDLFVDQFVTISTVPTDGALS